MHIKSATIVTALSVVPMTCAFGAQAQDLTSNTLPAAEAEAPVKSDGDIIVTASRRSERLIDVPSSITALDGDKMNEIGVRNTTDYLTLVPGVAFRDSGTPGTGTTIIRGLNTGSQQITSTTATYIDDAPFSASGFLSASSLVNPDPDVADIDRIEVLKGPQGTLYGANSLGGLVRIVSKKPDAQAPQAYGRIEATTTKGGDAGYSAQGSLNLPLVADQLALRVNGAYRRAGGFIDDVGRGKENFNWSTVKGGKASLRWTPTRNLTFDLSGMIQAIHNNGSSTQLNASGTLNPLYGRYKYFGRIEIPSDIRYRLATASASYDLGPATIIATGAYSRFTTKILSDYTNSYYAFARPLFPAILPENGNAIGNFSPNMEKWTGEIRVVSKRLGSIEVLAGGFYTHETNVYNTTITALDANGVGLPGNRPNGIPNANLVMTRTLSNYEELAGFVNGTFYIVENLDVGGGIRYAHNTQRAATGAITGANTFYAPRARRDFAFSDNVSTYLATIRYRPTSHISMYLRVASGYRPGGPQTNPAPPTGAQTSIRPDTTWNYEGGVKANLGSFSIDASVYHIDWKDIQLNTLFGGVTLGANGGAAKIDGFEMALGARPGPNTTFSANVGYTDARIDQVDPGVRTSVGAALGDRLPLTPDWTVSLLADQNIPLGNDLKGNVGATLRFRSDLPSSFPGAVTDPSVKIPSVATVDLRASLSFSWFDLQVRAENLLNAYGFTTAGTPKLSATQQVPTSATVIRPRTLAVSLSSRF